MNTFVDYSFIGDKLNRIGNLTKSLILGFDNTSLICIGTRILGTGVLWWHSALKEATINQLMNGEQFKDHWPVAQRISMKSSITMIP
jgi:hypothetical protein